MSQLRPDHYGGEENPFEPIKIIHHYNLNFNRGNVVKYILRAGKKGGQKQEIEDLRKVITYAEFELRRMGADDSV